MYTQQRFRDTNSKWTVLVIIETCTLLATKLCGQEHNDTTQYRQAWQRIQKSCYCSNRLEILFQSFLSKMRSQIRCAKATVPLLLYHFIAYTNGYGLLIYFLSYLLTYPSSCCHREQATSTANTVCKRNRQGAFRHHIVCTKIEQIYA